MGKKLLRLTVGRCGRNFCGFGLKPQTLSSLEVCALYNAHVNSAGFKENRGSFKIRGWKIYIARYLRFPIVIHLSRPSVSFWDVNSKIIPEFEISLFSKIELYLPNHHVINVCELNESLSERSHHIGCIFLVVFFALVAECSQRSHLNEKIQKLPLNTPSPFLRSFQ